MSSTPTLFNSGTLRSQLASCYLTTVSDNLDGIYEAIKENAMLAKYAGGLGNDWTPVRALGSYIKGTNGKSQGVVPFLKVVNDTAVAVNQGGKRKGAVCSYLETWHLDIEEFLELRKNTGDDRRRTHDMNTANWVPDLFMKRVMENADWTLFSPSDVRDLHDKFGKAFEKAYLRYEDKAARGELKLFKKIPAVQLWRKMLSMLFETGHPWITFKDPCNLRSPQQHVGVVHSSNLCTEITLNTSARRDRGVQPGLGQPAGPPRPTTGLDIEKLKRNDRHGDADARQRHRHQLLLRQQGRELEPPAPPGGPGDHGLPGLPAPLRVPYASPAAVEFADRSMEMVAYTAYWASTDLAEERGRYSTFKGSLWDRGILPLDTLDLLADERGGYVECDRSSTPRLGGAARRASVPTACATPTASPSRRPRRSPTSSACRPRIEPTYQNLYVKSNLSGEFTVVNEFLVRDLKQAGLWDEVMIADLKYFDGNLARIDRAPAGPAQPLRDGLRDRAAVAGRGGRAAPEVGRPVAVAQHLHGGRFGQEARRHLQARLAARTQDHLLPAHHGRDPRREVDHQDRASSTRCRRARRLRPRPSCAPIDNPDCEACQ